MRWWLMAGMLLSACNKAVTDKEGDDTSGGDDSGDTGNGGGGNLWRPSGTGFAWFVDGEADNSVLHLEMSGCTPPEEGTAYYGWVSKGGSSPLLVGEITVTGEDLVFDGEFGQDALLEGYDSFEAWATDNGGTAPEGTQLWAGSVDPTIYGVVQELLLSSETTPGGEGSLRSLESYIEDVSQELNNVIANENPD